MRTGGARQCLRRAAGAVVDAAGNLFIADTVNHRIRKVNSQTRIITTADGHGVPGLSIFSVLKSPRGVAVAPFGNLFIADTGNHRIRNGGFPIYSFGADEQGELYVMTQGGGLFKFVPN